MPKVSNEDRRRDQAGRAAIARLSKPIRGRTLAAQLFVLLSAGLSFVPYLALVWLGDIFLQAQEAGVAADARHADEVLRLLLAGFVLKLTFHAVALAITHFADLRLRLTIRRGIVERLGQAPLAWFGRNDSGSLRSAIQDDTKTVHTVIAHAPVDLLNGLVSPLVLLLFMFALNWRLALVGIATVPIYVLLYGSSMKDMGSKTAEMNAQLAAVSSTMVELVAGIKVVKAFAKTGEAHERYTRAATTFADTYWEWCAPMIGLCSVAAEFVSMPLLLLVNLCGGGLLLWADLATLPQILACTLIAIVLPGAMMTVANITWSYQLAGSAAERLVALLDTPILPEAAHPAPAPGEASVSLEDVSYSYGGTQALDGVSLELRPNSLTALIGPSGSGKSTLASLVARFDDPDSGSVKLGGVDLRELSSDALYDRVSFVLQDSMLLNASVRRNIALGRPDASLDQVREAARLAQIDDLVMSLPKGYDTVLGSDWSPSGGEGQRLSIARAILSDAPVLIMDEATAFADPDSELEIQRALMGLVRGRTVLVIAHRLNSIIGADQIAVMERGRIVALGTHETLQNNAHYQALLRQGDFPLDTHGKEAPDA